MCDTKSVTDVYKTALDPGRHVRDLFKSPDPPPKDFIHPTPPPAETAQRVYSANRGESPQLVGTSALRIPLRTTR